MGMLVRYLKAWDRPNRCISNHMSFWIWLVGKGVGSGFILVDDATFIKLFIGWFLNLRQPAAERLFVLLYSHTTTLPRINTRRVIFPKHKLLAVEKLRFGPPRQTRSNTTAVFLFFLGFCFPHPRRTEPKHKLCFFNVELKRIASCLCKLNKY